MIVDRDPQHRDCYTEKTELKPENNVDAVSQYITSTGTAYSETHQSKLLRANVAVSLLSPL